MENIQSPGGRRLRGETDIEKRFLSNFAMFTKQIIYRFSFIVSSNSNSGIIGAAKFLYHSICFRARSLYITQWNVPCHDE